MQSYLVLDLCGEWFSLPVKFFIFPPWYTIYQSVANVLVAQNQRHPRFGILLGMCLLFKSRPFISKLPHPLCTYAQKHTHTHTHTHTNTNAHTHTCPQAHSRHAMPHPHSFVHQVGDILDRGDNEVQICYFLERLQAQALAAGGRLYVLNGK